MGGPNNFRRTLLLLAFVAQTYLVNGQSGDSCDHDIYFLIDASTAIEPSDCISPPFIEKTWTNWQAWRQQVVDVLKFFEQLEMDDNINIGVQLYSGSSLPVTFGHYTIAPNFTAAIASISSLAEPLCNGRNSFVPILAHAIDSNYQFDNWVYRGPTMLRPRETTTRTAIVMSMSAGDSFSDSLILQRMIPIHEQVDNEIYITKDNIADSFNDLRDRQVRLAACGDTSMNCSNLFYMDALNDFGVPLSFQSIMSLIEDESCSMREVEVDNFNSSCDPNGFLTFIVPTVLLGSLASNDMQYLDSTCVVTSTVGGSNTEFTVALGSCGDVSTTDGSGNTVIFQQLSSRLDDPLKLRFNATCSFPTSHMESIGPLKPQGIIVRQDIEKMSTYPLSLALFTDDTFTNPLAGPATIIVVGCEVYIEGYSTLPTGLNMVLVSLVATSSSDPNGSPSYTLVQDNCPIDDTFMFLPSPSDSVVRSKFKMFEFASEVPKQNENKLPIFLHATFLVCMDSDNSATCTQGCVKRRRRDSSAEYDLGSITKTIGPFFVDSKRDVTDDDDMIPDDDVIDYAEFDDQPRRRIELVIPQTSTSYSVIGHTVFFVVAVMAVVFFVRQFIQRPATTNVFSSPGVVPYHHCAKTQIDYPHCYVNNALPPPCDACCEKSSVNVEAETDETTENGQPPQYSP